MCLVARITPCCVVSAFSLLMEPELPRVGPLKSQISKHSMEMGVCVGGGTWGS